MSVANKHHALSLRPVDPKKDCPAFLRDDHGAALNALTQMNARPAGYRYKTGALNIQPRHLMHVAALADTDTARADPTGFFLEHFAFFDLVAQNSDSGLLTGFFEPLVDASAVRTAEFPVPLYAPPDDLVQIADTDDTSHMPAGFRFARRRDDGGLEPYFDRRAIEQGALDGRAHPIVFVRDRVVAFFIHVQGAACLVMPDGSRRRITYAAKSGHPFTGIGRLLVERGDIAAPDISMQSIKAWLYANKAQADAMMWQNQSFIFFRQTDYVAGHPGPIAAAKVPLTPNRSIAVDRMVHTFGSPFFIQSPDINGAPYGQTMIAQDTGSAIIGAARADLYFGTGDRAGEQAGGVKAKGRFTLLVPHQSVAGLAAPIVG